MRLKKSLALLLALVMLLGMLPMSALAGEPAVAKVGDTEYTSFAEAAAAALDNDEVAITLLADISSESYTLAKDHYFTVIPEGHTIADNVIVAPGGAHIRVYEYDDSSEYYCFGNAAKIGDVEFETLASALKYAEANSSDECTITILDSWPEEATDEEYNDFYTSFRIGNDSSNDEFNIKNLTVNLNGFGSDGSENVNLSIEVYDGCTVTITNGTLDGDVNVYGDGKLIIDKSADVQYDVAAHDNGEITINGAVWKVNINDEGVVTINEGASVYDDQNNTIEMQDSAKLNINGGTITGGVLASGVNEVNISGGKIEGSDYGDGKIALFIPSGTLNISGGEIEGIAKILKMTDSDAPVVNITGGTIGALDVDDDVPSENVTISGGTFDDGSGLKEDYIAPDYQATEIDGKTIVWMPGSKNVTFKVVNGTWDDETATDKTEVAVYNGGTDLPKLTAAQIPTVGNKPGDGFKEGSWDVTPNTETAITEDTTYTYTYAQKDSISQTVTFKVENGSWDDETTTDKTVPLTGYEGDELTLSEEQIPAVGTMPNDGFAAGSWDKEPDTAYVITEDTTYTYTYSKVYKILYDLDGGTNDAENPTTFVAAERPVPIKDPVKEHYTFEGWSTGTNPGGRTKNLVINSALWDVELTAHWKPVEYEITYYLDKGTNAETNPETYTIESDDITLDEPTKTGYTFAGWTGTGLTGATREVKIANGSTGPREYWATWTVGEYELSSEAEHATVAFTVNGTAKATAKMGDDVVVTVTPDTGYTVNAVAYYVGEDTMHAYALTADTAYTFKMPADNVTVKVTLNAPATYTVNLVTNGGKINDGNVTGYTYGVGATLPTDVTRDYYEFAGWYRYQNPYKDPVTEITATDEGNATYYAKWTPVKYTITYNNLNGGTNANPAYYTCEDATITLADPARDGYTFIGWTGEDEYTPTKNITIPAGSRGEKTFTANWTQSTYSVTVSMNNSNVGSASVDKPNARIGDVVTVTATPKQGYEVEKITVNGTKITGNTFPMSGANADVMVYFKVTTYTVKFNANGGEGDAMDDQTFTVESVSGRYLRKNTFTETGNSFAGWATAADGAVVYADEAPLNTVTLPTDGTEITLFAVWTADSYSVSTDVEPVNSGTLTVSKNAAAIGEKIRVTVTPATGYELDTLVVYPKDSTPIDITTAQKFGMPAADVTVKATFKKVDYTATLYSAGGAYEGSLPAYMVESDNGLDYVINYNIGDKKPLPTAENFKKTGYAGPVWYDNANRTGTAYTAIPEDATGNKNFFAKWTANQYYAVFDANGAVFSDGNATKQLVVTYDGTYELPEVNRSGYTFGGWFTEKDGGTKLTAETKVNIQTTTTFYAHWTADEGEIQKMLTDAATCRYEDYNYFGAFIPNGFSVNYYIQQSVLGENSVNVMNDMDHYLGGLYRNAGAKATKLVYNGVEYTWNPEEDNWANGAGKTLVRALTDAFEGNSLKVGQPFTINVDGKDVAFTFYCQNYVVGAPTIGNAPAALVVSKATDAERSAYKAPDGHNVVELYHIDVYINNVLQTGSVELDKKVTLLLPLSTTPATVKAVHGNDKTLIDATIAEGNAKFAAKNFSDYAIVTPATYNVTLHWHGGADGDANVTVTYGEAMPGIQVPAKNGYDFAGYFDKEDGKGTKYYNESGAFVTTWDKTADATLHAYWTAKSYDVKTKATPEAGGTITVEDTAAYGSIVTFEVEAKTGYALDTATLKVWAGNEELTVYGNHDGSFCFTMPAADVTIEAGFTADTYTVTLNTNGGTIAEGCDVTGYTHGTAVTLPDATQITKTGSTFAGWYASANFTGNPIANIGANATGNKVFYAKWEVVAHDVTVEITGKGTFTPAFPQYGYGAAVVMTSAPAAGYQLTDLHAYKATDGAQVVITLRDDGKYTFTMPDADVTVKPVFTAISAAVPTITQIVPAVTTVAYGTSADVTVTAAAAGGTEYQLAYQWYSCDWNGTQRSPIEGATTKTLTTDAALDSGTYYYICTVTATRADNGETASADSPVAAVTVEKAAAAFTAPVAAENLEYNSAVQALVTPGTTADGTLMYRIKPAEGTPGSFSESIPMAKDAGTYTVEYYVKGDVNHTDSTVKRIDVEIAKKPVTLAWSGDSFVYDGAWHVPTATVNDLCVGDSCTVTVSGGQMNVGTYTATAAASTLSNPNYVLAADETKEFSITKATDNTVYKVVMADYAYGGTPGTPQLSGYTGNTLNVTYWYYAVGEDASAAAKWDGITGTTLNVGQYNIYAVIGETANYTEKVIEAVHFNVTPATPDVTAPAAVEGLVYNSADQTLIYAGSATGGTMQYSLDGSTWDTKLPVGKDAKTYNVYYKVEADGNYAGTEALGPVEVTIARKPLSQVDFAEIEAQTYDGTAKTPEVSLYYISGDATVTLTKAQDYTVAYTENVEAGVATAKVTGHGNYEGIVKKSFMILPETSDFIVTLKPETYTYDGAERKPSVQVQAKAGGATLQPDTDYTLEYVDNVNAGTAYVLVRGVGNYEGAFGSAEFTIDKAAISPTVSIENWFYGESAKTPVVSGNPGNGTVSYTYYKVGEDTALTALPKDVDNYTVVAVIGETANYAGGTASATFSILPRTTEVEIVLAQSVFVYDGTAKEPAVTVTAANGGMVIPDDQYTVTYSDNTNAGQASLTVVAKAGANFRITGDATKTFTIEKATVNLVWTNTTLEYTGLPQKPTATAYGVGKDAFPVTVTGEQTEVGRYVAYATELSNPNYKLPADNSCGFYIVGTPMDDAKVTITLNKTEYPYDGTAHTPVPTVKLNGIVLTAGTDYNFHFEDNVNAGVDTAKAVFEAVEGGKLTGQRTVNFTITPKNINADDVVVALDPDETVFNRKQHTPEVSVEDSIGDLQEGKDFTVAYGENKYAGEGTVKITGTGNYTGERTEKFTILKAPLASCSVEDIADQVYTGSEIRPDVTVTYEGQTVKSEKYELTYQNNVNVGTATVYITAKDTVPNFTGSTSVTFQITPKSIVGNTSIAWIGGAPDATYSGEAIEPDVVVKDGTTTLEKGVDYQLSYAYNVDAWQPGAEADKQPTVTITGIGNYKDAKNKTFAIKPFDIQNDPNKEWFQVAEIADEAYTGAPITPKPAVTFRGTALVEGRDFEYQPARNTAVMDKTAEGAPCVVVSGKGNFTGSSWNYFSIIPADLTNVSVTAPSLVYNGNAQTYNVTATATAVDDATVTFQYATAKTGPWYGSVSARDAGTYTIYYTATAANHNAYTGTFDVVMQQAPITIKAKDAAITYGDAPVNNGVDAYYFLSPDTDAVLEGSLTFTYTYEQYDDAGAYEIIPGGVTAKNYAFTFVPGTLTVAPKTIGLLVWSDQLTFTYDGSAHKPTATVDSAYIVNGDVLTVTVTGEQTNVGGPYTATATGVTGAKQSSYAFAPSNNTQTFKIESGSTPGPVGPVVPGGSSIGGGSGSGLTMVLIPKENGTINFKGKAVGDNSKGVSSDELVTLEVNPAANYKIEAVTYTTERDNYQKSYVATKIADGVYQVQVNSASVQVTATFEPINKNDPSVGKVTIGNYTNGYANCDHTENCPLAKFDDLKDNLNAWYHDGIHYCLENGIMQGFGDPYFRPYAITTRAQVVTTLWNIAGHPIANSPISFSDVSYGDWYYDAIMWAAANGIVEGYGDGKFGPNDEITHEQIAKIFYGYAKFYGFDVSAKADISKMAGVEKVSNWAYQYIEWAVGAGVCCGVDGNTSLIAAPEKASRAELATMILNFCTKVAIKPAAQQ